jgi:hypothetical protein
MFKTLRYALKDELDDRLNNFVHRKCKLCGMTQDQRIQARQDRLAAKAAEAK